MDVSEIARYFFKNKNDKLKTQKLLYYAQCTYMKCFDKPLFSSKIEHWDYGPVVPEVWREWDNIINNTKEIKMAESMKWFLDTIDNMFSNVQSPIMIDITHESLPWKNTLHNEEITFKLILELFPHTNVEKKLVQITNCYVGKERKKPLYGQDYVLELQRLGEYARTKEEIENANKMEKEMEDYAKSLQEQDSEEIL